MKSVADVPLFTSQLNLLAVCVAIVSTLVISPVTELYLELIFHKYPLTIDRQQYKLNICKRKILEDKLINLKCFKGMEFDKVFKEAQKYLEKYKAEHREYNLTKPERGGYL